MFIKIHGIGNKTPIVVATTESKFLKNSGASGYLLHLSVPHTEQVLSKKDIKKYHINVIYYLILILILY